RRQLGRVHQRDADAPQLVLSALVEPGDRVLDEDEAKVALARLVDGRARAVREVAPREHERGDAERTQVGLERRLEEGAPARLVDDRLARPDALDAPARRSSVSSRGALAGTRSEASSAPGEPARTRRAPSATARRRQRSTLLPSGR